MPRDPAPPPAPRGRFITLEGGEGAGKSTQAARLVARLAEAGRRPEEATLAEMDALWNEAKARERAGA